MPVCLFPCKQGDVFRAGECPAGMRRAAVTLSSCPFLPNTAILGVWLLLEDTAAAFENEQPLRVENALLGLGEGSNSRVELLLYLFVPFSAD